MEVISFFVTRGWYALIAIILLVFVIYGWKNFHIPKPEKKDE